VYEEKKKRRGEREVVGEGGASNHLTPHQFHSIQREEASLKDLMVIRSISAMLKS
jgi:hypothetical protein